MDVIFMRTIDGNVDFVLIDKLHLHRANLGHILAVGVVELLAA